MATKQFAISTDIKTKDAFEILIMDALGSIPNFSTSVNGLKAKCDEISAPTVGMGANSWTRGRAYTEIALFPKEGKILVSTSINGWTGAIYNGKYADEIGRMIGSKIKAELTRKKEQKTVSTEPNPVPPNGPMAAEELIKWKQLLDMGGITEEEYQAKKKQLLGL
ncbi:MAG: SHOCT domain-containing protein [Erysipelotrichaceae bacterium]|nr:SHOCT domain-containing protein [Erysipelotrichaceae bacterium]